MPEETTPQITAGPLVPVAELVERTLNRFGRFFSGLFPWLVLSCIGGFLTVFAHSALPLWQRTIIAAVGVVILLISYLAEARIIAGVEKEPKDIVNNGKTVLGLFFPYALLVILEIFIFLGGSAVFFVPAIILGVYIVVLPFVFVVEDGQGLSAFTRSWGYVAGRWWLTLWRMIVIFFLVAVIMTILNLILNLGFGSAAAISQSWGAVLIQQLIEAFVIMPLLLSYLFELYLDLRATKPTPAVADEKTARLWLVIFLTIGIIIALVLAFGTLTHTAARDLSGYTSTQLGL